MQECIYLFIFLMFVINLKPLKKTINNLLFLFILYLSNNLNNLLAPGTQFSILYQLIRKWISFYNFLFSNKIFILFESYCIIKSVRLERDKNFKKTGYYAIFLFESRLRCFLKFFKTQWKHDEKIFKKKKFLYRSLRSTYRLLHFFIVFNFRKFNL